MYSHTFLRRECFHCAADEVDCEWKSRGSFRRDAPLRERCLMTSTEMKFSKTLQAVMSSYNNSFLKWLLTPQTNPHPPPPHPHKVNINKVKPGYSYVFSRTEYCFTNRSSSRDIQPRFLQNISIEMGTEGINFAYKQATKVQRGSRGAALLIL